MLPRARAKSNIVAVEEVPHERVHMYGVVGVGEREGKLFGLTQMVEKPSRETAPSNLIITGRYILQPEIFDVLAAEQRGAGGEIQLTDAMIELAKTQPFYGLDSKAAASTAARRSASSTPTSPMRSSAPTSRRRCGPSSSACSATTSIE